MATFLETYLAEQAAKHNPNIDTKKPGEIINEEFERYNEIPESYNSFVKQDTKNDPPRNVDPSSTTRFANLSSQFGGGQFAIDTERPTALIKSDRIYTPEINTRLRNGLSSKVFEIDHRLPLWAGGTDTEQNKQALTIAQHEKKTKIGAVARTLYYNGDINLNGARALVLDNWTDKDVSGITVTKNQKEDYNNGKLSLNPEEANTIAQTYYDEWTNKGKVKVSAKDVWNEAKSIGTKAWDSVIKTPVGQYAASFGSSLLFGWPKLKEHTYDSELEERQAKYARTIGTIGGTIVNFRALGVGLSKLGTSLNAARLPWLKQFAVKGGNYKVGSKIPNAAVLANKLKLNKLYKAFGGKPISATLGKEISAATKAAGPIAKWAKSKFPRYQVLAEQIKRGEKFAKTSEYLIGSGTTVGAKGMRVSKGLGAKIGKNVALFGTHGALTKQEERTFGSTVGAFTSGAIRGGLFAAAEPTLISSAGLWLAAYSFGCAEESLGDDDPDYANAALNATIMVGLNAIGRIGYTKRMKVNASESANNLRVQWAGGNKGASIKVTDMKGNLIKVSEESVRKSNDILKSQLMREIKSGKLTFEQAKDRVHKIIITSKQLINQSMPATKRVGEDIKDVTSIIQKAEASLAAKQGIPSIAPAVDTVIGGNAQILINNNSKIFTPAKANLKKNISPTIKEQVKNYLGGKNVVIGKLPIVNRNQKQVDAFNAARKERGINNSIVVIVPASNEEMAFDEMTNSYGEQFNTGEKIDKKLKAYGIVGGVTFPLGDVANKKQLRNVNMEQRRNGLQPFGLDMDNNSIAKSLGEVGAPYGVVNLENGEFNLAEEGYALPKMNAVQIGENMGEVPSVILKNALPEMGPDRINISGAILIPIEKAVATGDIDVVKAAYKKALGTDITTKHTKELLSKKATVQTLFAIARTNKDKTELSKGIYSGIVEPFFKRLTPENHNVVIGLTLHKGARAKAIPEELSKLERELKPVPTDKEIAAERKTQKSEKSVSYENIKTKEDAIIKDDEAIQKLHDINKEIKEAGGKEEVAPSLLKKKLEIEKEVNATNRLVDRLPSEAELEKNSEKATRPSSVKISKTIDSGVKSKKITPKPKAVVNKTKPPTGKQVATGNSFPESKLKDAQKAAKAAGKTSLKGNTVRAALVTDKKEVDRIVKAIKSKPLAKQIERPETIVKLEVLQGKKWYPSGYLSSQKAINLRGTRAEYSGKTLPKTEVDKNNVGDALIRLESKYALGKVTKDWRSNGVSGMEVEFTEDSYKRGKLYDSMKKSAVKRVVKPTKKVAKKKISKELVPATPEELSADKAAVNQAIAIKTIEETTTHGDGNQEAFVDAMKETPESIPDETALLKRNPNAINIFSANNINQAVEISANNKIEELAKSGEIKRAARIYELLMNFYTREKLKALGIEKLMDSNEDTDKAFIEFKKAFIIPLKRFDIKSPIKTKEESLGLRTLFNALTKKESILKVRILNGKMSRSLKTEKRFPGDADKKLKEYSLNKGKDFKLVHYDSEESNIKMQRGYNKAKTILKHFEDNHIIPLWASGNTEKTIKGVYGGKDGIALLVKDFDENSERYLVSGESIPTGPKAIMTKAIKVINRDALLRSKDTSASRLSKRGKLLNFENLSPLPKGEKIEFTILGDNRTVGDSMKDGKSSMYGSKPGMEALTNGEIHSGGTMFIIKETADKMNNGLGTSSSISRFKPVMNIDDNGRQIPVKGYFTVADGAILKAIEKMLGRKVRVNEIIGYSGNMKENPIEVRDGEHHTIDGIPSSALRVLRGNKPSSKGSVPTSLISKFAANDDPNGVIDALYKPKIDAWKKLSYDAQNASNAKEFVKAIENYGTTIENVFGEERAEIITSIKNGGGFAINGPKFDTFMAREWKSIMNGRFLNASPAKLIVDTGVLDGKFLPPKSCMMSKENWLSKNKPKKVLLIRQPLDGAECAVLADVFVGESYNINNLGLGKMVVSNETVSTYMNGDWDGDAMMVIKIGGEGGFPKKILEDFVKKSNRPAFVAPPLEKANYPLTLEGVTEAIADDVQSGVAVEESRTFSRLRTLLKDMGLRLEVDGGRGDAKRSFKFIGKNDKVFFSGVASGNRNNKENYPKQKLISNFGKKQQETSKTVERAATDAAGSLGLRNILGEKGSASSYLIEDSLGTNDPVAIKAMKALYKEFQGMFRIVKSDKAFTVKVDKGKDIVGTKALSIEAKNIIELAEKIESVGGRITPFHRMFLQLEDYEPLKFPNKEEVYSADEAGSDATKEFFKDIFELEVSRYNKKGSRYDSFREKLKVISKTDNKIDGDNLKKLIRKAKGARKSYTEFDFLKDKGQQQPLINKAQNRFKDKDITNVKEARKAYRQDAVDYFKRNGFKLNQSEKDAFAFWLITASGGNIVVPESFAVYNKDVGRGDVYRFLETISSYSPKAAKAYLNAYEKTAQGTKVFKNLSDLVKKQEKLIKK